MASNPFSISILGLFTGSRISGGATIDLLDVELTTTSPPSFFMVVSIVVGCCLSSFTAWDASLNSKNVAIGVSVPQPERNNEDNNIKSFIQSNSCKFVRLIWYIINVNSTRIQSYSSIVSICTHN